MALDAHYITDGPLEEAFLNKDTGLPLSGGFITFYRDSSRITPKPVYELTGAPPAYQYVPLSNPIELSSIGTVQNVGGDNVVIYYYPWLDDGITPDLYYIEVTDSNNVVQFTREAWPNGAVSDEINSNSTLPVQNQISNPQFTKVFINDVPGLTPTTTTYSVSAATDEVFEFAPDWNFIISGTGNVVVSRVTIAGISKVPTSPPYVLDIQVDSGISSCYLSQRFNANSGLWASTLADNIFLSTNLMARNELPADTSIQMYYNASSGTSTLIPIFDKMIPSGTAYTMYTGSSVSSIPLSDDTNSGTSGYVDIYISFTPGCHVRISSVQVVPTFDASSAATFAYDEASANRDQALLGSYYIPRNINSPIPSLLTAWDFPLNPAQFGSAKTVVAGTPSYVWDQMVCNSTVGNVAFARNSVTNALQCTPVSANASFYLAQYLTGAQAKEILYNRLSSNISAYLAAPAGVVTVRAYLYSGTAASVIPILTNELITLAANGTVSSPAVGWTQIARSGLDTPRAQITAASPIMDNDIKFTGWEIVDPTLIADTDKFAMLITFAWTTAPVINVMSISLNKGDLPTRPAAQTLSDVLSECQFYYEKSYNTGVSAGAIDVNGALSVQETVIYEAPNSKVYTRTFGLTFNTKKRTAPTVLTYSTGVSTVGYGRLIVYDAGVQIGFQDANITLVYSQIAIGQFATTFQSTAASAAATAGAGTSSTREVILQYHYTADARLGVIA